MAAFVIAAAVFSARPALAEASASFEEAFGAASAFAMYNTQVVLGITADAFVKSVYSSEEAKTIVSEQKTSVGILGDYVKKLLELSTVNDSDKKYLKGIQVCLDKLSETADALTAYIDNQSDENAGDFDTKRKASYDSIAELPGLDKQ
ncbi:MAG TPA: hypothetical protein PLQ76_02455 [bacterium]|nr:hypothetical protein [bacterium]